MERSHTTVNSLYKTMKNPDPQGEQQYYPLLQNLLPFLHHHSVSPKCQYYQLKHQIMSCSSYKSKESAKSYFHTL